MRDKPRQEINLKKRSVSARVSDWFYNAVETVLMNFLKFALAGSALTLMIIFFIGLSILSPGTPGQEIPRSQAQAQITATPPTVRQVTLRDQDARMELVTTDGRQEWAAYPHAHAYTSGLPPLPA